MLIGSYLWGRGAVPPFFVTPVLLLLRFTISWMLFFFARSRIWRRRREEPNGLRFFQEGEEATAAFLCSFPPYSSVGRASKTIKVLSFLLPCFLFSNPSLRRFFSPSPSVLLRLFFFLRHRRRRGEELFFSTFQRPSKHEGIIVVVVVFLCMPRQARVEKGRKSKIFSPVSSSLPRANLKKIYLTPYASVCDVCFRHSKKGKEKKEEEEEEEEPYFYWVVKGFLAREEGEEEEEVETPITHRGGGGERETSSSNSRNELLAHDDDI